MSEFSSFKFSESPSFQGSKFISFKVSKLKGSGRGAKGERKGSKRGVEGEWKGSGKGPF